MPTYDFRILLETIEGNKSSYFSSSFVNTDNDLVLSASQVWHRITGSVSCSYYNSPEFSPSLWSHPDSGSINTSYVFKDNTILSASLTGSLDTGAILFSSLDTDYDRLLRYKFFGDKVCGTLGLPNNQWIYVDQMRLPADDESNYFEGNVNAKNIYISNNLSFANNSTLSTDLPIFINTGSDRHLKFIDERDNASIGLFMGYDKDNDQYEIGGDNSKTFNITNVDFLQSTKANINEISHSSFTHFTGNPIEIAGGIDMVGIAPNIEFKESDITDLTPYSSILMSAGRLTIRNSVTSGTSNRGDVKISTENMNNAIYIRDKTGRVGIGIDEPEATLHVVGDLKVEGAITSSIVSSSIMYSSGSNIFGDEDSDSHTFNGDITASNNISASGTITTNILSVAGGAELNSSEGSSALVVNGDTDQFLIIANPASAVDKVGIGQIPSTFKSKLQITGDLSTTSHITASGNISSSGGTSVFGEVVHLEGTDPRLKLKAKGANHPGVEWHEDSSRKWVIFNDPANDHMTWKNASNTELMELDQDGQLGIGTGNPTVKLQVAGDISGSELFLRSDDNPLITLERNSDQNVGILYKNTNGHMVAGIDEDLQNDGANIFGIGYHGDIIDNDGSNHATFVVTGSQVVVNNATTASNGAALTVGGTISGKTYKSEKLFSYKQNDTGGTYYFSIGGNDLDGTLDVVNSLPAGNLQQTAMCDTKITRLKINLLIGLTNMGYLRIILRKYDGSGDIDNDTNWGNVGTYWALTTADVASDTRYYHAPSDWELNAGDIWALQFRHSRTSGFGTIYFNGAIILEEDWNNQVSS